MNPVSERLEYEDAVATNPIKPGEGHMAYIIRIAETVAERLAKHRRDWLTETEERHEELAAKAAENA